MLTSLGTEIVPSAVSAAPPSLPPSPPPPLPGCSQGCFSHWFPPSARLGLPFLKSLFPEASPAPPRAQLCPAPGPSGTDCVRHGATPASARSPCAQTPSTGTYTSTTPTGPTGLNYGCFPRKQWHEILLYDTILMHEAVVMLITSAH